MMNSKFKEARRSQLLRVPLLDLGAQHGILRMELDAAIARVLDHGHFINGPEVDEFEVKVAHYCGVKYAVGMSSGTDALLAALMALDIKSGDEVITSAYSFFATAGAVARLGAIPVFVDIDPITFNLDPDAVERAVTKKTKAIIPVHLFGQCADMRPILKTAHRHGLRVIEDAAQALGAEYREGSRAGSMGDIGCFSFFPSKNLGAIGDAGMAVTNDDTLVERLRILRNHGSKPKYYHKYIGGNFRLDTIQAAVLTVKFNYLDEWTRKRKENAARYRELFTQAGLVSGHRPIILPKAIYQDLNLKHNHIYNQFVIRAPSRERTMEHLHREGIGAEIYYPRPFHLQECFKALGHKPGDFPEAEQAASDSLAIPVFPELTTDQQSRVVSVLAEALGR